MNRPIHFEVLGDDPEALGSFYSNIFGWKVATWGGPQNYWLVTTGDGVGIDGGFMHRHFPQAVINTIGVESLDATIERVRQAGGKVVQGPDQIPGVGMHAYCSDPEGNLFGVLQPEEEAAS